jgi:hypothetical protein
VTVSSVVATTLSVGRQSPPGEPATVEALEHEPSRSGEPHWMRELRRLQAELSRRYAPLLRQAMETQAKLLPPERLRELQRIQGEIAQSPAVREAMRVQVDLTRRLEPVLRQAREAQARFLQSEQMRQVQEVQRAIAQRPDIQEAIERLVEFGEQARVALRDAMPNNWQELGVEELPGLIELTAEHGVAVVWAPRGEVVAELLAARTDEGRDRILVSHRSEILEDLTAVVAETNSSALEGPVRAAGQAVDAARAGIGMAAQSLVGSTLTNFVNHELGHERFDMARTQLRRQDPDEVALDLLRETALLHCLANAIEHTSHAKYGFNRHATAGHGDMFEQYDEATCLRGLLLLVGLLREFSTRPTLANDDGSG